MSSVRLCAPVPLGPWSVWCTGRESGSEAAGFLLEREEFVFDSDAADQYNCRVALIKARMHAMKDNVEIYHGYHGSFASSALQCCCHVCMCVLCLSILRSCISLSCPHLFRYVASCLILQKRLKHLMKDFV